MTPAPRAPLALLAVLAAGSCARPPEPSPPPASAGPEASPPPLTEAPSAGAAWAVVPSGSAPTEQPPGPQVAPPEAQGEDDLSISVDSDEKLPEGFVHVAKKTACGDFTVEQVREPGPLPLTFVRVTSKEGKRVYEAHGRQYKLDPSEKTPSRMYFGADFCGDLTGDGVPELAMTEKTEGAHCCYTHYVVSLTTPPRRLLMWEKGDGGFPLVPVKYRKGPGYQLEGAVVFWPPFAPDRGDPVISYASAPVVPAVFSLVKGELMLTSLSFPEAFKKQREQTRASCKGESNCGELIEWIDGLVVGDWPIEKVKVADPELRRSLDKLASPTLTLLSKQLGSARGPAPTSTGK